MEAKDGSFGFDFAGTYTKIVPNQLILSIPSVTVRASSSFCQHQRVSRCASRSMRRRRIPRNNTGRAGRRF